VYFGSKRCGIPVCIRERKPDCDRRASQLKRNPKKVVKHSANRAEDQVAYYCAIALYWMYILSGNEMCKEYGLVQVGKYASLWEFTLDPPIKILRRKLCTCENICESDSRNTFAKIMKWIATQQQQNIVEKQMFD